jgi:LCP family protein required for cell wall assembly
MNRFIKTFIISLIIFLAFAGNIVYNQYDLYVKSYQFTPIYSDEWLSEENPNKGEDENPSPETLIENSGRINFLLAGLEGPRTDTIIFISFDSRSNQLDLISIPRDTYFYKKGFWEDFDYYPNHKINAIYGNEGIEGLEIAVSDILGLEIDNYATITYSGVKGIIDSLGGVEIDVPFDMYYEDKWDDPPLVIDIKAGPQVLYGEKSVQFLRFRQNSDGSVKYGDIQRIGMQQKFMKQVARKALSFKLPLIVDDIFRHVRTDASLTEVSKYSNLAVGLDLENINFYTVPGEDEFIQGTSFYVVDYTETRQLVFDIYEIPYEVE